MWSSLIITAVLVGVIPSPPRVEPSPSEIAAGLTAAGAEVLPPPGVIEHMAALASVALEAGVLERIETGGAHIDRAKTTRDFWGVIAPEWRDTSGAHAIALGECRTALIIDQLDPCLDAIIPELWMSHAARLQSTIVMRLTMADGLGPIDRVRVTSALLTVRDRAVQRLQLIVGDEALDADLRAEALDVGVVLAGIAGSVEANGEPE